MKANTNIAELIRHIQELVNKPNKTAEELQELDFYEALKTELFKVFVPGCRENIIPIYLRSCPIEKTQELARTLGLQIVEGGNAVYLSWSKDLDE